MIASASSETESQRLLGEHVLPVGHRSTRVLDVPVRGRGDVDEVHLASGAEVVRAVEQGRVRGVGVEASEDLGVDVRHRRYLETRGLGELGEHADRRAAETDDADPNDPFVPLLPG